MAQSFIGSLISLISASDIRYRGILQQIDYNASTIQLADVYSLGTEDRRPPNEFLPPNSKPYDYIVFRATEVKDLVVERRAELIQADLIAGDRGVQNDPAVLGAGSGGSSSAPAVAPAPAPTTTGAATPSAPTPDNVANDDPKPARQPNNRTTSREGIRSAEVAVESVERAMDALRVSGPQNGDRNGGGRRGGRRGPGIRGPGVVPETPFDFNRANAKFDKGSLVPADQGESPSSSNAGTPEAPPQTQFYDKKKSFFDDISSDSKTRVEEGPGGRQGGPQVARQKREEERNRNLSTFGETGLGQWHGGGGGRRGGRRRGGPPGGGGRSHAQVSAQ